MSADHRSSILTRRAVCAGALCLLASPLLAAQPPAPARNDLIGRLMVYITSEEDTLLDIARAHDLGYTEIVAANPGVDPWLPGEGQRILLPTAHLLPQAERRGIVINLADQRLYWFDDKGKLLETVPIGIGSEGWKTPLGQTKVHDKRANPIWYVPKSIREADPELPAAIRAGPDNPLGAYAIRLDWTDYLIHGTNNPWGVGRRVSHGCIRLYPEDIKRLYPKIAIGTPVTIVDQPVKLGWSEGMLMLEVHPTQAQADELERGQEIKPEHPPEFEYRVKAAAGAESDRIDWRIVRRTLRERMGVPVGILKLKETASSRP